MSEKKTDDGLFNPLDVADTATEIWVNEIRPEVYPPNAAGEGDREPSKDVIRDALDMAWDKAMNEAKKPPSHSR